MSRSGNGLEKWAAAALALLALACQRPPPPAEAADVRMPAGGASPFYAWEHSVPADPGQLLRSEPLEARLVLENAASGTRILYSSESFSGAPTVVSGAVFLPNATAPDEGWPVLAWSHGTVGSADACAPSFQGRAPRDLTYLNHWLAQGYAIVATDYEGLGTGGPHPYLHCASEAFGNIDAVRAARQLDAPLSNRWLVLGQSQGGQGALCTGAYAGARARELEFLGTLATAPGVNFLDVFGAGAPNDPMPFLGFVLLLVHGMDSYTASFDAEATLSERAAALLARVDETCTRDLLAEGRALELTNATTFKVPLREAPGIEDAAALMDIPITSFDRPVLIAQGTADELLPPQGAIDFSSALCAAGAQVTLKVYQGEPHSGPMKVGLTDFTDWVASRFAGEPASDTCAN